MNPGSHDELEVIPHLGTFHEDPHHHIEPIRLTDHEYALATQALLVVCTDVVLVDEEGRYVLAYRRHPAAEGWWWKGGSWKAQDTRSESIARILERELGYAPRKVVMLAVFDHFWSLRGEVPHDAGRHDIIFLHYVVVDEATIANMKLDEREYESERGFMRYDGSQEVRPVVKAAYELYMSTRNGH